MLTIDRKIFFTLVLIAATVSVVLVDKLILLIPVIAFIFLLYLDYKPVIIITTFVGLISFTSGFGETERLLVQISSVGLLLFAFVKQYGTDWKTYPKLPLKIIYLVSAIILTIIISLFFTDYFSLGLQQLIRTLIFFLIIYFYYTLLTDRDSIKYFLSALFAGALIYFVIISYEIVNADFDIIYLNQNLLLEDGIKFIHRNAIGGFFSICISIAIAFLFNQNFKKERRFILYTLVIIFSLGLILTNSRAAIFSLLFGVGFILFNENKKLFKKFILGLAVIAIVVFVSPLWDLANLYFRLERISTGRDYILETVYNILSSNPIIGFGPAATKLEMYNYLPYMFGTPQEYFLTRLINQIEFGHAHNFYLFLYTDLGLLGLIVSLLIPFTFIKMSNSIIKNLNREKDYNYYLVVGLKASGISLFIRGLFEWAGIFSYGTISYDLPFWWVFILLVYLYQTSFSKDKIEPKPLHNF